jgi:hypothetical protein
MKETKFTPGPWKAHSVGEGYVKGQEIFQIHWSDDGECVAEIVHGADDAHLISAAPDLYDALEALLYGSKIDEFTIRDDDGTLDFRFEYGEERFLKRIEAAKVALRKARGKA